MSGRIPLTLLAVVLVLGACTPRPTVPNGSTFSFHRDPQIEQIKRVVVMPFHRARDVGASADAVDDATAATWRELGPFEVITASAAERDALIGEDAFRQRSIATESLRQVFAEFRADAVLIGRIEHLDSYDPVSIGLECALVSCLNGAVLWQGGGHFDAGRKQIQDDLRLWYRDAAGGANASVSEWRSALQSPRLFARYVSDRLAVTALDRMTAPPTPRPPTHSRPR